MFVLVPVVQTAAAAGDEIWGASVSVLRIFILSPPARQENPPFSVVVGLRCAEQREIYDCATPIAEAEEEAEKDEGETFFRHAPAFCALERQPPQLHGGEMFTLYSVPTLT